MDLSRSPRFDHLHVYLQAESFQNFFVNAFVISNCRGKNYAELRKVAIVQQHNLEKFMKKLKRKCINFALLFFMIIMNGASAMNIEIGTIGTCKIEGKEYP